MLATIFQHSPLVLLALVALAAVGFAVSLFRLKRQLRHEVEERRKAEAAAELARAAKGRYLAMMTHEVRTPINGILGYAQLLEGTALSGEQQTFIDMIAGAARQMMRLSNDVLDYEKIEAGSVELEQLPVNPAEFLADLCAQFAPAALDSGITIHRRTADDVPETVLTDPTRLRQILSNLISNALKFTPRGGRVDISVEAAAAAGSSGLRWVVSDTGPGIEPEQLERLFRPFVQADATVNRRYGGFGLGLAIAQQLTELLGGKLEAESIVGAGSRFSATIKITVP